MKLENDSISQELNETKAKLADANKKKVKLMKIDSVEVKPTIFGNKVTLLKDDFDNIKDLAEKEVVSIKQTKKLTALNQQLQQENVELQSTVNNQAQELSKYKQPANISMKQLKEQDQSRRELDSLKSKLNKALSFIQEYGLLEAYQRYRTTSKAKESLE